MAGAAESFDFEPGGLDPGTAAAIGGRIGARAKRFVPLEATVDYAVEGFAAAAGPGQIEAKALLATADLDLYPIDSRIQPFVMGGVEAAGPARAHAGERRRERASSRSGTTRRAR